MLQSLTESKQTMTGVTGATYGAAIEMNHCSTLSVQSVIDVNTPADDTFVDGDVTVATDLVTITAHGLFTGLKLQLTTTGTLPGGLSTSTDYFIINLSANTISFASSLANAIAGTAVTISSAAGGGTHTIDITALAAATISYQRTNISDDANDPGVGASTTATDWSDIDDATDVTVDATNWYSVVGPTWRWFRVKATCTAGSMTINNYIITRGEDKK